MKNRLLTLILFAFIVGSLFAKITLPDILSDNMVLQQNTSVKLWGKATQNALVKVTTSWNNKIATVQADKNGNWLVKVQTPKATFTPQTITFSDGEKTLLTNILIGEVWLASGQSNMEMPLGGYWNCPVKNANETIAKSSKNKGIRFATVPKTPAYEPQETTPGKWKECNPNNAPGFSATAYYFAQTMYDVLEIPVGIIVCSWGGSRVESWLNREILETYPDIDLTKKGIEVCEEWKRPLLMYNGMLKPLTNYTIKGFIWYQGESNVGQHSVYAQRLATMVQLWRDNWGQGNLPFYFVELAPWIYGDGEQGTSGALLREAQFKAQSIIPNSGMVCTNDLVEEYEKTNIHPRNKMDVGKRLAYIALNQTYDLKGVAAHGPEYKSMEIKDGKIIVSFNYADEGFNRNVGVNGFEIAGADKVFYPADVEVNYDKKTVILSNKNVPAPVAVRYCFKNYQPGNLANTRELPMVPFRTDDF